MQILTCAIGIIAGGLLIYYIYILMKGDEEK